MHAIFYTLEWDYDYYIFYKLFIKNKLGDNYNYLHSYTLTYTNFILNYFFYIVWCYCKTTFMKKLSFLQFSCFLNWTIKKHGNLSP